MMTKIQYNKDDNKVLYDQESSKVQIAIPIISPCAYCADSGTPFCFRVHLYGIEPCEELCMNYMKFKSWNNPNGDYDIYQSESDPCYWYGTFPKSLFLDTFSDSDCNTYTGTIEWAGFGIGLMRLSNYWYLRAVFTSELILGGIYRGNPLAVGYECKDIINAPNLYSCVDHYAGGGHGIAIPQQEISGNSWLNGHDYIIGDAVIGTDSKLYICLFDHTSSTDDRPTSGGSWALYWFLYESC